MNEQNMAFPIPNSVLEPYIKAAVSTAIASSLGDAGKLVELAVQQALTHKVSANGGRSSYDYENKYQLVEVVAKDAIQKITRETIQEMAEQMRPKIKEQIEKQLRTQHGPIAKALVDGLINGLKSSWSVRVDINTTEKT